MSYLGALSKDVFGVFIELFNRIEPSEWQSLMPVLLEKEFPELQERKREAEPVVSDGEEEEEEEEHARKRLKLWKPSLMPTAVGSGPDPKVMFHQGSGSKASKLYIRQCTRECFDIIWNNFEEYKGFNKCMASVVTGPPGLGKSWSSNMFVWLLLQKKQNIWFHSASDQKVTIFKFMNGRNIPNISEKHENYISSNTVPEFTWFLYDSVGGGGATDRMIKFKSQPPNRPCIIFSSPKDTNYKRGVENMEGAPGGGFVWRFWMPSWEWYEIQAVMKAMYEESKLECSFEDFEDFIKKLYNRWGGIPRRINRYFGKYLTKGKDAALEYSEKNFSSEMVSISRSLIVNGGIVDSDMLDKAASSAETETTSRRVAPPSWLVFPFPLDSARHDTFTEHVYKFCSRKAEHEFFLYLERQNVDAVRRFCMDVFRVRGAAGVAFERFAHFVLTRSEENTFRWKRYNEKETQSLELPKCDPQTCDMKNDLQEFKKCVSACIQNGTSVVIEPMSDQQDAIDMFVVTKIGDNWRVLAMQDTISKTHSFHPVKILEYKNAAEEAFATAEQEVSDDFFLHVVVVPNEHPEDPFRLLPASRPSGITDFKSVKGICEALGVNIDWNRWTKAKAREVCKMAKIKNYTKLDDDKVMAMGAGIKLSEQAAGKVVAFTWVLDGFL